MQYTRPILRLQLTSFLAVAIALSLCAGALAADQPYDLRLANAGVYHGEEALYLLRLPEGFYYGSFHQEVAVLAVRADGGAPLATLFDRELAAQLFPDARRWYVQGVDSMGRVYVMLDAERIALVAGGQVAGELAGAGQFLPGNDVAFDDGLVGGNRFTLLRSSLTAGEAGEAEFFPLPIKTLEGMDPPGAWLAVSRDGGLIYVSSEWEARAWDSQGNLRFDLGTVYPHPYTLRDLDPQLDPELLYSVPRLYFNAPWGCFDPADRLWLYYRGEMWAVDAYGQELTARFELPGLPVESALPSGFCFGDDATRLYVLDCDGQVYIYDVSPTLEQEQSELNDLYYPKGLPPVLVASYPLELDAGAE